jgi:hypothetical protein
VAVAVEIKDQSIPLDSIDDLLGSDPARSDPRSRSHRR